MALKTANFGLTKPDQNDNYDVAVQNGNMDIIDGKLKKTENAALMEIGTVDLQNTKDYPFNDSEVTVALAKSRDNLDYTIDTEITAAAGSVESAMVEDKQLNGFKLRFVGSGTAATIKYYVKGGFTS